MFFEVFAIAMGLLSSYFLKDIQFLSLEFDVLNIGLVYPDFLLMFITFFALYRHELVGTWVGFFGGLLEDGANWFFDSDTGGFTTILGIHSLVYTLVGYGVGRLSHHIDHYNNSFSILLVLLTAMVTRFLIWSLHGLVDTFSNNYAILGPAIYTAFLIPLWFTFLLWVYRIARA